MRAPRRWALGAALAFAAAALLVLGTWQVRRLAWKRALIAQVEARIHAAPVPPPAAVRGAEDAYLRVVLTGRYLPGRDTFVQAVTARGAGFWVLTPLVDHGGRTVLVNRGFRSRRSAAPQPGPVRVVGLLRVSEPGGAFLRSNDPAADRWFSRDVQAIAAKRGVRATPYFVDAEATAPGSDAPVGGLTVVRFPNNHLVYALTWYALAAMAGYGVWRVVWR